MSFWDLVIDQIEAKKLVRKMFTSGRVPHALLIWGPPGSGRRAIALALAQSLLCESPVDGLACGKCRSCISSASLEHPDLHVLWPAQASPSSEEEASFRKALVENPYTAPRPSENLGIAIDRIRTLQRQLALRPYYGRGKVGILLDAEYMRPEAANALLKTLEEPPKGTLLVLTAFRPERLLPTVRSRCQEISLHPLPTDVVAEALKERFHIPSEKALAIARASGGDIGKAYKLCEGGIEVGERALEFIEMALRAGNPLEALVWEKLEGYPPEEVLEWVLLWIRDAFLLGLGISERVTFSDKRGILIRLSEKVRPEALESFLQEARKASDMLSKNMPARWVLWYVWWRLYGLFRG